MSFEGRVSATEPGRRGDHRFIGGGERTTCMDALVVAKDAQVVKHLCLYLGEFRHEKRTGKAE